MCDDFCWEGGRRGQLYRNAQTNPDQLRFPVSVHSAKNRASLFTPFSTDNEREAQATSFLYLSWNFKAPAPEPRRSGKISPAPDSSCHPPCVVTFHGAAAAGVALPRSGRRLKSALFTTLRTGSESRDGQRCPEPCD